MFRNDLKIFIISHQDTGDLFKYEECYHHIHVGADINEKTSCEYKDNIGDNISLKNPFFCELTGIYWVWKNMPKSKYIGFEHYRRHFPISTQEINDILEKYDIIMPTQYPINISIYCDYCNNHSTHDINVIEQIVKDLYPEYNNTWYSICKTVNTMYYRNMFITKYEIFDNLCSFIFNVLTEFEKREKLYTPQDYEKHIEKYAERTLIEEHKNFGTDWKTYQMRICGFIAERLTTIWVKHNIKPEKIFEIDYESSDNLKPVNKIIPSN